MSTPSAHELAMVHAKIALMNDPKAMFLYNVCFHLKFVWDDTQPTAAVDGYSMFFNTRFFAEQISHEMRITLLAHETGHVIRDHITRQGNREHKTYNYAGDYVINQELKDAGYTPIKWKLDDGTETEWLQDDRFKDMTTEQVYDILYAEKPPQPTGGGGIPSTSGDGCKPGEGDVWADLKQPPPQEGGEKPTPAEVKQHIDEILISAAMAAKMGGQPGSIPSDVQVYLDSLLKPKLPMVAHLRRFFQALQKNDYSWQRPNRRHLPMYLPSMRSEALSHIVFAFDMSRSVKDSDLKRYVSELVGVLRNIKPDKLSLILFDTEIKSITEIRTVQDLMNVKLIGRGGTDVGDLLEWARKNKPKALCVFTDGEFHNYGYKNPGCPILWMIHNRHRTFSWDYGTVIPFEV